MNFVNLKTVDLLLIQLTDEFGLYCAILLFETFFNYSFSAFGCMSLYSIFRLITKFTILFIHFCTAHNHKGIICRTFSRLNFICTTLCPEFSYFISFFKISCITTSERKIDKKILHHILIVEVENGFHYLILKIT